MDWILIGGSHSLGIVALSKLKGSKLGMSFFPSYEATVRGSTLKKTCKMRPFVLNAMGSGDVRFGEGGREMLIVT